MKKSRSSHDLPDRRNAPKRTGKKMLPPEDPHDQQQGLTDGNNRTGEGSTEAPAQIAKEAAGKKKGKKQGELLKVPKQPTPRIQNGKMSVHFVGFRAHRLKNRTKVVTMKFSMELEEEHKGHLPEPIEKEWQHFEKGNVKLTQPEGVGVQNVRLSISSDVGEPDLDVTANLPKAVISHVVVKGKGATTEVTRLVIELLTTYTADVDKFCRNCFDETVWLQLEDSQTHIGQEEEGEE